MTYSSYRNAVRYGKGLGSWTACQPCIKEGHMHCWTFNSKLKKHPECPNCKRPYGNAENDNTKGNTAANETSKKEELQKLLDQLSEEEDPQRGAEIRKKIKEIKEGAGTGKWTQTPSVGELQTKKDQIKRKLEKDIETLAKWEKSFKQKQEEVRDAYIELDELDAKIAKEVRAGEEESPFQWEDEQVRTLEQEDQEKYSKLHAEKHTLEEKFKALKDKLPQQKDPKEGAGGRKAEGRADEGGSRISNGEGKAAEPNEKETQEQEHKQTMENLTKTLRAEATAKKEKARAGAEATVPAPMQTA